ncbi:MAG: hypothetical protein M5U31_16060 [Acidimicrobiia bacterium]|nr:hypothetical protein [Acidimicrobiia bacterium]
MGVFVLGMHRSGTSSVTRLIDLLGVPVGEPQLPPQPDNPSGFWEVASLMEVNDDLLARLGGWWDAPPDLPDGWESDQSLDDLRSRAAEVFRAAHPGTTWVWKDPRVCLLLPFWRPLTGSSDVAMVVLRNPLDVAHSLNRRAQISIPYGLALWERYLRAMHRDARGMPALVVRYDDVLDDAAEAVLEIRRFLVARGELDDSLPYDPDAAREFMRPGLRHTHRARAELDADGRVSPAQRALFDCLDSMAGEHDSFAPPPLPPETPLVAELLSARAEVRTLPQAGPEGPVPSVAATVDRLERELGSAERALAERDAEAVALRARMAGVSDDLGGAGVGRVERAALRVARAIRSMQRRRPAG